MPTGSSFSGAERRVGDPRTAEGSTGLTELPPCMNKLFVGFSRNVELPRGGWLLIDDEIRDAPRARVFDPDEDCFNPMQGMDYRKARELSELLYAIYPQGDGTLTVRNGKRALLKGLLKAKRLDEVEGDSEVKAKRLDEVEGDSEVEDMIGDLLMSPILRRVLCNPTDIISLKPNATIMARLNRAELGDFDALVLGFFLMAQFKGQVVVPDFGFYGRNPHASLIRENRLIAGVNYLGELPDNLRSAALLIEDKEASRATPEDADILARLEGKQRGTNGYNDFVKDAMA